MSKCDTPNGNKKHCPAQLSVVNVGVSLGDNETIHIQFIHNIISSPGQIHRQTTFEMSDGVYVVKCSTIVIQHFQVPLNDNNGHAPRTVKCSAELQSSSKQILMRLYSTSSGDSHSCVIKSWTYSMDFSYVFPPTSCMCRAMKEGRSVVTVVRNSSIHGLRRREGCKEMDSRGNGD